MFPFMKMEAEVLDLEILVIEVHLFISSIANKVSTTDMIIANATIPGSRQAVIFAIAISAISSAKPKHHVM